jgi:hypothetical protein
LTRSAKSGAEVSPETGEWERRNKEEGGGGMEGMR